MTMNDVQVIEAKDAFGAVVGYRGVVRVSFGQATGLLGCTCKDGHPTHHEARRCETVQQIVEQRTHRHAA